VIALHPLFFFHSSSSLFVHDRICRMGYTYVRLIFLLLLSEYPCFACLFFMSGWMVYIHTCVGINYTYIDTYYIKSWTCFDLCITIV
jgi:hypothetical protein